MRGLSSQWSRHIEREEWTEHPLTVLIGVLTDLDFKTYIALSTID